MKWWQSLNGETSALQKMDAKIDSMTTAQILAAVRLANKQEMTEDVRMVRARLITHLERREGEEFADRLMQELGL